VPYRARLPGPVDAVSACNARLCADPVMEAWPCERRRAWMVVSLADGETCSLAAIGWRGRTRHPQRDHDLSTWSALSPRRFADTALV